MSARAGMLALALAASSAAAAPICEELPARRGLLEDAKEDALGLDVLIASMGRELGVPALGDGLPNDPAERAAAAALRLERACAEWAATTAAAEVDRDTLAEILARSEFAVLEESESVWVQRVLRWLRDALDWLFASRGAESFAEGTRFLVLAAATVVVLYAAFRAAQALRRRGPRGSDARGSQSPQPLRLEDPELHLDRARSALEADAREAIREGLLALLSSLERRRLARPDRVKTNRELAAELPRRGASPELHARVDRLLRWYDAAFYSLQPVRTDEAHEFLTGVGETTARLREEGAR